MPLILVALIALIGAGVGWFKFGSRCECPYANRVAEPARLLPGAAGGHEEDEIDGDWRDHILTSLTNDAFQPNWLKSGKP